MSILKKISDMFAAAAFAEEGEQEMAREIMRSSDKAGSKSSVTRAA